VNNRPLAVLALAAPLCASPVIRDISPHGAQRGKTVRLLLKGSGLAPGAKLETTLPAGISRLAPSKDLTQPGAELPFLVEIRKDAPIGLYPLRLLTDDGLSNVALFSVGEFPEVEEKESEPAGKPNGDTRSAEPVPIPSVVNGSLSEADVDLFVFKAAAGQRLVFEMEANAAASAIDPAIELLDPAGKVIARNDDAPGNGIDPRLEHTFPRAGAYYVRVHDSKYSDQSPNFYRLKIGSYSYNEGMFPLGWRRGQPVAVELNGGNLASPVTVRPDTNSPRRFVPVALPGSASLPQLFTLSDKPEMLEPAGTGEKTLPAATVVNGRISAKGEVDRYRLAVKPGEQWIIELAAASTGASQMDALVTVYGKDGKKLASRDDLGGADPVIPFEVPKDVHEVAVAVEDLLGRGGPQFAYRLEARKEAADFQMQLVTPFVNVPAGGTAIVVVNVQRRGYDGAVKLSIPNLPPGYIQAGGTVAPAAAQQRFDDPNPRFSVARSTITITAGPEAKPARLDLSVRGVAELPGGGRMIRYATGPGLVNAVKGLRQKAVTAGWLEMELPMATARALPVRVTTPVTLVRIAQGVEYPLVYKVEGSDSATRSGRARENIATQVGNLRILQGPPSKPGTGSLLVNTNFATPTTRWDFLPTITAEVDGKPMEIYGQMVEFEVAPGYRVTPAKTEITLAPGGSAGLAGSVYREPTFEGGLVKIELQDLPEGVSCGKAEAAEGVREFALTCEAAPGAMRGDYEVRLVSQAPETGRKAKDTYKGPEATLKLRIK